MIILHVRVMLHVRDPDIRLRRYIITVAQQHTGLLSRKRCRCIFHPYLAIRLCNERFCYAPL